MDLIRWNNRLPDLLPEFETLREEIDRLFDLTRRPEPRGIFEGAFSPALDVVENPDSYGVICDLPGVDLKDVEISLSGNVLTIKGEKKRGERKDARSYRDEPLLGRFQRTLQLPLPVDADKVEAVLKDGVLRVILPKREELKPRQVTVKAN